MEVFGGKLPVTQTVRRASSSRDLRPKSSMPPPLPEFDFGASFNSIFDLLSPTVACHRVESASTSSSQMTKDTDTDKSNGTRVAFADKDAKEEQKRRKSSKPKKSSKPVNSKPQPYHHTPAFAAQSFVLTTTPEVYKKKQTHTLSRPVLEQAKTKNNNRLTIRPPAYRIQDESSSSDGDKATMSLTSPVSGKSHQKQEVPVGRYSTIRSPHYDLFSSVVLQQSSSTASEERSPSPSRDRSFRRPDWTEMDEKPGTEKKLRRMASVASTKASAKSKRSRRHSVDLSASLNGNGIIRAPRDDDSIYQGRSCIPRRYKPN